MDPVFGVTPIVVSLHTVALNVTVNLGSLESLKYSNT